jgi:hypothetical protein
VVIHMFKTLWIGLPYLPIVISNVLLLPQYLGRFGNNSIIFMFVEVFFLIG